MPKSFSIEFKKRGHFLHGAAAKAAVASRLDPAIKRAGLVVQGGVQVATPVVTGTLRRSMATGAPEWKGSVRKVQVGSNLVYARPVNVRGRSKGYFKRGIDSVKGRAKQEIQTGLASLAAGLFIHE